MRFLLVAIFCCLGLVFNANAQKSKKSKAQPAAQDNAFAPIAPEKMKAPARPKSKKSFSKKYYKTLEDTHEEFQQRMEANAKKTRKKQRAMEQPQYSDPSYFGHKKKPKKRKPGQRKFCKECGIVH